VHIKSHGVCRIDPFSDMVEEEEELELLAKRDYLSLELPSLRQYVRKCARWEITDNSLCDCKTTIPSGRSITGLARLL
jgi:hypothetical protein